MNHNNTSSVQSCRIGGVYGITPDRADTADLLSKTSQVLAGGVRLIQYRNKTADADLRNTQAKSLLQLCRQYDVPLIINDHIDLAMEIGADGVHVGEQDASVANTRKLMGPEKIIGASCYNRLDLALTAQAEGADYVAFGAFYPTTTKQNTVVAPLEILDQANKAALSIPVVSIGGINTANALALIQAGADAIAVSQALYRAEDICKTAKVFSGFFLR
ncbi:MAG: thiamine phosphate synthase [Nitrosomonas sp.]|nr:thiamine phosphate synthase [Nitrosomonas sp.]